MYVYFLFICVFIYIVNSVLMEYNYNNVITDTMSIISFIIIAYYIVIKCIKYIRLLDI